MNRREFLWLGRGALVSAIAMGGYANQIEPHCLVLERRTIRLPHLSPALDGFRIALMSDHHLFAFTPRKLLERAVEQANELHLDRNITWRRLRLHGRGIDSRTRADS